MKSFSDFSTGTSSNKYSSSETTPEYTLVILSLNSVALSRDLVNTALPAFKIAAFLFSKY